jgi:predicted metal-dependent enzyme (double-stranded beta helix superfamily)
MLNLSDFTQFDDQRYARHLVLKTGNMEVLVVCWLPGQGTPFHGHGPTDGLVLVVEGEICNTDILPDGRQVSSTRRKGDICHTPVGYQHRMANHSNDRCITMHVYSPPLGEAFLNPDLGYSNEVTVEEIQLPDEMVQVLMASPARLKQQGDSTYSI